jgi:predicted nucleotidyltransferase
MSEGLMMLHSIQEIKTLVAPVARKFDVTKMWLFGSYARGEATVDSDIDFRFDRADDGWGIIKLINFQNALSDALGASIDAGHSNAYHRYIRKVIAEDEVLIYDEQDK